MRYFSNLSGLVATIAFTMMCTGLALADGTSVLKNALVTTMKLPSYHMTMVTPVQGTVEADVINPGRMHMTMKGAEIIVVGQTMYMKQGGAWRKYPGVDVMQTQTDPFKKLAAEAGTYTVADVGMKVVGGVPMHAYRSTSLKNHNVATLYVDGGGRIVRMETGTTVMTMSKFGEAVSIVAPM
jgi:hypothetical protein